MNGAPPPPGHPPPQRRGCLFYGCLTLAIVALAGMVTLYIGYRYAKSSVEKLVAQYTDTAPMEIGRVTLPEDEYQDLKARVDAFGVAMEKRDEGHELVLTARDINGLISGEEKVKELRDKVFVRIEDDRIEGDISVPLPDIGPLKFKGRYLNGSAAFRVSLTNETLDLRLDKVQVNGKPLPDVLMAQLRAKNLLEDEQNNPDMRRLIRQLESLRIQDGKIILRNRVSTSSEGNSNL